jgi:hypothetical protein
MADKSMAANLAISGHFSPDIQSVITSIAEIISICQAQPHLEVIADATLDEIMQIVDNNRQRTRQVQMEITQHVKELQESGRQIKLRSPYFRMIAMELAQFYNIPFDSKQCKKKDQIIQWMAKHWKLVKILFFSLLDNIEDIYR